jgi:hypothetical protein
VTVLLALTLGSQQWTTNLRQVFTVEHHHWHMGPYLGEPTRPVLPG